MSKPIITVEEIQAKTIRETVAMSMPAGGSIKKLIYVFPVASGLAYWRVVIDSEIVGDHLDLAQAVQAYNAG